MDSQRITVIMFITICLSLFLESSYQVAGVKSPSPSPPNIPPLVKKLCAKTAASEGFCIKTLTSDKLSWQAKNFVDLTKIFLSSGKKHAQNTQNYIDGLAKKKGATPKSIKALNACGQQYSHIFANFNSALGEVEDGDYLTANYDVMVSSDDINMCKSFLSDAKLSIKGISDAYKVTNYFINIGATFTDILDHPS
ncbi:hypothetical protein M5689_024070 [Euphorbia peplus]|nr:hypothetical protein M5689_024070 [Euphorbia peplus]